MSNKTWGIYCPPVVTFNTLALPKKTPAQRHNDETARDQTRFSSQVLKLKLQCSISHAIDQDLKEDMSTVLQDRAPTSLSRQKNNFHVRDRWAAEWDYPFFWKEYNLLYVTCEVFTVHLSFRELLLGVDRYVFFRADTDYYRSSRPITDILNRYMCLV